MSTDLMKELRSVTSLLSTEAAGNKQERSSKITEYFKDQKSVTFKIPSMSVWSLSNSSANPQLTPKTNGNETNQDDPSDTLKTALPQLYSKQQPPPRASISKAILRHLVRKGNPFPTRASTTKWKNKLQSGKSDDVTQTSISSHDLKSILSEGGEIDHEAVVKNMSTTLTFEKVDDKNPTDETSKVDKDLNSKVNEDVSFVADTFAQNLKNSVCKVTDDHVIYYLSRILERSVKGGKGIIPYEAAKILAHYGSIDKVNTEDADNELAMKSFQESEDRKSGKVKKEDEEPEIIREEEVKEKDGAFGSDETKNKGEASTFDKTLDSERGEKNTRDDSVKKDDKSINNVEKEEGVDNEERTAKVKNDEEETVDHIAKIKSIHGKSPSLRQMLGLDDEQKLNELPSLETKVKKFTTSFDIIEDSEHKIPEEGEFSCGVKFNAILTLVILKHETTLQVNESGMISGFINKDKSFKNLSLSLQVDSLFKSFVEIIKSSVKNALGSDSTSGTIPNQRFQVEVAPVDKIVSPPKPGVMNVSTQDSQASRKRRRSEFNVNDMAESFRSKRGSIASLLPMTSMPNYGQDSTRASMLNFNDSRRGSMNNFNDVRRSSMVNFNDNRRASLGMFGQDHDNRRASVAAMLGQNMIGNNNQGMNQLMNQGMNPFMNMNQSNNMINNNQFNTSGMNSMNGMKGMNDSNNMYSDNNDRLHPRTNSFADAIDAVRFAERRQSQTRQSRALALAAAENAKMNEIKAAMKTLKRSSVGRSTGVNSMAAAAEAVRLADMENNLDSLGSKIADSRDNKGNTNNFYNSLKNNDKNQNPSTSDLIRLLDNSRSSMVGGQDSSQVNMDQSQRMDLETAVQTLRRHSNLGSNAGGNELSGFLDSLGRDEGNFSARRRISSYGDSALMENVLKALRRQSSSIPRPSESGGSMAAAAEAVRLAEMDVMSSLRRRSSAGNSMASAADVVRQADLDAAMNTLRRRRSSAGNNSIAAAAEAVRLAEMENSSRRRSFSRRHSSYGGNSAMAAAAEIVRMSEENNNNSTNSNRNYSGRRSFMMSDDMMKESDDLNNVMRSASAVNNSFSGAAAEARLADTDGNLSSLLNSNNNFLLNQNNMDPHHRSRRVSFRLNNSSRDYGLNNGYQG